MLFEISLDYVVCNEFGNLTLFNNNMLETRQHSAVRSTSSGGRRAGGVFPQPLHPEAQSPVTGDTLAILTISRCISSSPQRSGLEAQWARAGLHICPTNSFSPGLTIIYLQEEWKPQCAMSRSFSIWKHTTLPGNHNLMYVFPTS